MSLVDFVIFVSGFLLGSLWIYPGLWKKEPETNAALEEELQARLDRRQLHLDALHDKMSIVRNLMSEALQDSRWSDE